MIHSLWYSTLFKYTLVWAKRFIHMFIITVFFKSEKICKTQVSIKRALAKTKLTHTLYVFVFVVKYYTKNCWEDVLFLGVELLEREFCFLFYGIVCYLNFILFCITFIIWKNRQTLIWLFLCFSAPFTHSANLYKNYLFSHLSLKLFLYWLTSRNKNKQISLSPLAVQFISQLLTTANLERINYTLPHIYFLEVCFPPHFHSTGSTLYTIWFPYWYVQWILSSRITWSLGSILSIL